ncbi:flagellar assembly protein FliW [Lysinibacillus capsici]|uniref:flagellar assembly protein FliW n=1 Tax=Lysinibacillus capsici TaxID=2115968 RepID=UPI0034E2AB14
MKIKTKFLGEIEINYDDIVKFNEGLPGFRDEQEFILIPLDVDIPLLILQSVKNAEIGFILAYPFAFKADYAFDISEEDRNDLQIEEEQDVVAYSIVTMNEKFADSTLNLLAPVIININKRLGKQIVLLDSAQYPLRFPMQPLEGSAK